MTEEEKPFATDYDGPWKEALDFAPRLFLARFQSTISQEIDWTEEPRSLDEELRRMSTQDQEGIRRVDRLLLFKTLSEDLLYLHIEVQCFYDPDLGRRVMTYRHRLRARHDQPMITIVVLGDERRGWRPKKHKEGKYGSADICEWIPIKLLDLSRNMAELESDENVFALFVAAHLETMATRKDLVKRQEAKNRILSNLQSRNLDKADGGRWYDLIDWLMKLPKEMNEAVYQKQEEIGMKWGGYAAQKGRKEGEMLGRIHECQELLKQKPTPDEELLGMKQEELETLLARLREQLAPNGR